MKNALDWIKSNPISAVSIVISFIGVVVFVYIVFVAAPALRARVVKENSQQASELQKYTNNNIELPNPNPNEPPIEVGPLVINDKVIEFVEGVYDVVRLQSSEITGRTRVLNSQAHADYTFAGGRLFGVAEPAPSLYVEAKKDYRNSFDAMFFDGYEDLAMPRINAGTPPTADEVFAEMDQMLAEYLQSVGAEATADLTQAQAEELYKLQQVAVMELLRTRAESIQLYADVFPLPMDEEVESAGSAGSLGGAGVEMGMGRYGVEYPFQIEDWAFAAEQPTLDQVWEAQVQVWITRDIMQAINRTNSATDPNSGETYPMNVIEAPVKRLLRLEVVPGYVGLHTGGAINLVAGTAGTGGGGASPGMSPGGPGLAQPGLGAGAGRTGGRPGGGRSTPGRGGGLTAPGGAATPGGAGRGGSDPEAAAPATATDEVSTVYGTPSVATLPGPNQPVIDSFFFGPTGRFSNSVFDVRHTRLLIHIDWASLPKFFEQLRQVNFMTVVDMKFRDIDEYGDYALADGYIYGEHDVVEVELVIESLWFRSWTQEMMPQVVKNALAIP